MRRLTAGLLLASALGLTLLTSGCAQEFVTTGDITRGNVTAPDKSVKAEPQFSSALEASRAVPQNSWKARIAEVPTEKSVPGSQKRKQVLEELKSKQVRIDTIDGLSIKQFANLLFAELLKVPVNVDPRLETNKQKVFLRAVGEVSGATAVELAQAALQPHGVAVSYENAMFTLTPMDAMLADTPPTIINRYDAETPDDLKPVIQFVKLTAIEPNQVHELMQSVASKRVKIAALGSANSVVVSGPGTDVQAAVTAIKTIDVPRYAGSKVVTINPTFISAKDFSANLMKVLQSEGYTVSSSERLSGAINIVSVDSINAVVIFAKEQKIIDRVLYWGQRLDQPAQSGADQKTFVYRVKNMAAEQLMATLTGLKTGGNSGASIGQQNAKNGGGSNGSNANVNPMIQASAGNAGAGAGTNSITTGGVASASGGHNASSALFKNAQFIVDAHANRILVQATEAEYHQIRPIVEQLDVPTRTVLIEVAIAEVSLTSNAKFGVEWLVNNLKIGGQSASVKTLGGLGLAGGGLAFALNGASISAAISALSTNNRVQILSTPRIVAKSGGTARIEVGTDVPIITSQAAGGGTTNGTTNVQQSVEYRKTGVILTVKPTIHGDDRVELDLEQELSEAAANPNPSIASPLIINRRVVTQLAVADGMTAVVGGLFSDTTTRGDTGVPGLKDLPFIGSAFRTDTREGKKTELLIFLRPYIIGGPREMADLASALRGRLDLVGKQPKVSIDHILGLNAY